MIYLDRTFCCSKGCINKCGRQWTIELQQGADKWVGELGLESAPVAFSTFCGNEPAVEVVNDK